MNVTQAKKALEGGQRLTHPYFAAGEYVQQRPNGGDYEFEDGCLCSPQLFWLTRSEGDWDKGWKAVTVSILVPHFAVDKPNINGAVITGESYFRALDTIIETGWLPLTKSICLGDHKPEDVYGWVKSYTYGSEDGILTLHVQPCSYEFLLLSDEFNLSAAGAMVCNMSGNVYHVTKMGSYGLTTNPMIRGMKPDEQVQ